MTGERGADGTGATRQSEPATERPEGEAARKRAAVELIARHGGALRKTARRYSLCADDAEDAYQRALEILLTKAPTCQLRELIGWTQTVTKREALAIRAKRERLLGPGQQDGEAGVDWIALIPSAGDGPDERVERREGIARSREALQALKPAELRALTLLAEGYTYAEIGEITGFSNTKVNRVLTEGRERFRKLMSSSEDGSRCRDLRSALSAFCDGEAPGEQRVAVREHLRACARCRATMRAYRATPGAVAALAPALPASRSILEKAHDLLVATQARFGGGGGTMESTVAQMAAGSGGRGTGMAALAKVLAVCAGTAGGAAACVAAGVGPAPAGLVPHDEATPTIQRAPKPADEEPSPEAVAYEPAPPAPEPKAKEPEPPPEEKAPPPEAPPGPAQAGAVEYTEPAPSPVPAPSAQQSSSQGSAAGEFGP